MFVQHKEHTGNFAREVKSAQKFTYQEGTERNLKIADKKRWLFIPTETIKTKDLSKFVC